MTDKIFFRSANKSSKKIIIIYCCLWKEESELLFVGGKTWFFEIIEMIETIATTQEQFTLQINFIVITITRIISGELHFQG